VTQTFGIGISGSDFNISSVGTTHTFNIPDAGLTARGFMSTGTQIFAGLKTFQSSIYTSNLLTINDGVTGPTPSIPNSYSPAFVTRVSQTTGSRPFFFGYDNGLGTGWA
jgi:hypothetical protein